MKPLKYQLWDVDGLSRGVLTVDPFSVASVVETEMRRQYLGSEKVAIIRMVDGKEYIVCDYQRNVQLEIWSGKSFIT